MSRRRLLRPMPRARAALPLPPRDGTTPTAPIWPSYTGDSQFVGMSDTGRVTVFVDPSLGDAGILNAQDLLADADRVVAFNDAIFNTSAGDVDIIVFALGGATDGTGGADHGGCDYQSGSAIELDASFGSSARVSALFEAELSECNMGGNLCGVSTGEALSRWCAMQSSSNALSDFATAPTWFADGAYDFVDVVDTTDQNPDSTGCGMAFISWLLSQGFPLGQVAQTLVAGGDTMTLAALYASLTGNDGAQAWPSFTAAIAGLSGVASDDPFGQGSTLPVCPTLQQAITWATQGLVEFWPKNAAALTRAFRAGPPVRPTRRRA